MCWLLFKLYPLIYRDIGRDLVVSVIADGRRDMQALLTQRSLGALSARRRQPYLTTPQVLRHHESAFKDESAAFLVP